MQSSCITLRSNFVIFVKLFYFLFYLSYQCIVGECSSQYIVAFANSIECCANSAPNLSISFVLCQCTHTTISHALCSIPHTAYSITYPLETRHYAMQVEAPPASEEDGGDVDDSAVVKLTDDNFADEVTKAKGDVFVEFYAPW